MPRFSRSVILCCLSLAFSCLARAQEQPLVQIISPKKNAIIHPGQTFEVEVRGIAMKYMVLLVGEDLETPKVAVARPPYKFRVKVAPDAELGPHYIKAYGEPLQLGPRVMDDNIDIDVERADSPVRITAAALQPIYLYVGEAWGTTLTAHYRDGAEARINTSLLTHYESSRPDIAWVSGAELFAKAPGEAVWTITNGKATLKIPFIVKPKRE